MKNHYGVVLNALQDRRAKRETWMKACIATEDAYVCLVAREDALTESECNAFELLSQAEVDAERNYKRATEHYFEMTAGTL